MKTRSGFVSNSSSSNFIVCFPRMPKDVMDLKNMMFNPNEEKVEYYDEWLTTDAIAERVYRDLGKKPTKKYLKELGGYMQFDYGYDDFKDINGIEQWESYRKISNKLMRKNIEIWLNRYNKNGTKIFSFLYADDGGESILEHGCIFRRLPHIRIWNH